MVHDLTGLNGSAGQDVFLLIAPYQPTGPMRKTLFFNLPARKAAHHHRVSSSTFNSASFIPFPRRTIVSGPGGTHKNSG
jgi:hypothetical protein